MNGYNFTERVRAALMLAREEAMALHHSYVGSEHLLLGLLKEGGGVAAEVLKNHQIDAEVFKRAIRPGTLQKEMGPDLPYTADAKRVLERSMREASGLHHSYVGTEHLLLGVLSVKSMSAEFLNAAGITLQSARKEIIALLGPPDPAVSARSEDPRSDVTERTPVSITVILEYSGGLLSARKFTAAADARGYLATIGR